MKQLEANEVPLSRVFSSDYRFAIPNYQRSYSWGTDQATQLLVDLRDAVDDNPDEPYFLGSVVLVKEPNVPTAQVIDGQQRLTTLTMVLCILRDLSTGPAVLDLDKLVTEPGDTIQGLEPERRLLVRDRDRDFFDKHVQGLGGTTALVKGVATENDAQARMAANVTALHSALAELDDGSRLALAQAIVQRTYLVVVSTPDLNSAYRIFSVMNSRGLELSPADIFKSQVIGKVPAADRARYAKKWEDLEVDLGTVAFADLFSHIRTVFLKYRARRELLHEFQHGVLDAYLDDGRAAEFVDEVLRPYGQAYRDLLAADNQSVQDASEINRWVARLHLLDNFDWQPAVLWAFKHHPVDGVWLADFLQRLDRLCSAMLICRYNAQQRGQRIGQLLRELDEGQGLTARALDLTADERADTLDRLNGEVYRQLVVRKYVLLRLDELVADPESAQHKPKVITVEHVLPQSPAVDSEWPRLFTERQREYWTHRLGNLVLLSRTKNSEAQNYDFAIKKAKYFTSKSGVSAFALTTQVLTTAQWTPDVLERRHGALIRTLSDAWRLAAD
jgi:hypothetical protein